MPNLWTTTNQKLYQAFHGPKVIDSEFNAKLEEVKLAEKNLHLFHGTISKFHHHHGGIKTYMHDFAMALEGLYDTNSLYYPYTSKIVQTHRDIAKLYDNYYQKVLQLHAGTLNWHRDLDILKDNVKERDRLRLIYEHYDDKIERFVRKRNYNLEHNKKESDRFLKAFERVNKIED
jgi:hypothetical protein